MSIEKIAVAETVTRLFVATDASNWQELTATFAQAVVLDYSSMTQQPAETVTPVEIVG